MDNNASLEAERPTLDPVLETDENSMQATRHEESPGYANLKGDLLSKNWLDNSDNDNDDDDLTGDYIDAHEMQSNMGDVTNDLDDDTAQLEKSSEKNDQESEKTPAEDEELEESSSTEKTPTKERLSNVANNEKSISYSASCFTSLAKSDHALRGSSSDSNLLMTKNCSVPLVKVNPLTLSGVKLSHEARSIIEKDSAVAAASKELSPSAIDDRRIKNLCNLDKLLQTTAKSSNAQKVKPSPKSKVKRIKNAANSDATSEEEGDDDEEIDNETTVAMDAADFNYNDFNDQYNVVTDQNSSDDEPTVDGGKSSDDDEAETTDNSSLAESRKSTLRPRKGQEKNVEVTKSEKPKTVPRNRMKLPGDGLLKSSDDESTRSDSRSNKKDNKSSGKKFI
jgi:hypothetical protein